MGISDYVHSNGMNHWQVELLTALLSFSRRLALPVPRLLPPPEKFTTKLTIMAPGSAVSSSSCDRQNEYEWQRLSKNAI